MNRAAVCLHGGRGEQRTGRLIHEWHELVGKARHRASDADAAHVGAAANAAHPTALANIALHHRSPTSEFHDAERGTVLLGELCLLVVSAAITTLMNRVAE